MLYEQSRTGVDTLTETSKTKILIVDDEPSILRFLRIALKARGYEVCEATAGEVAIQKAADTQPDLIILDLNLPDLSGIEVTRRLREWTQTPIVIISVQNQDSDKIEALNAGADDYLTKPFSIGELSARLRVALQYVRGREPEHLFVRGKLRVDLPARLVFYAGEEVQLTPTEYDLLRALIHHSGRVLTHQRLLKEIQGSEFQPEPNLLHVHMSNLRHKIEENPSNPQYILTEHGVGYRLKMDG